MSLLVSGLLFGIVSMSSAVDVDRPDDLSLTEAVQQGELGFSLRARYEDVSQQNNKGAQSPTLASSLFYESERYHFFSTQLEYTFVTATPNDDNYFDGSNSQTDDALVADPERSFFSRYSLAYDISNTVLRYGRQNLLLDNGRFVGTEEHRQGGSQVRGLTFFNNSFNYLTLNLGHLRHFDSAFGSTAQAASPDMRTHYFNVQYSGIMHSKLSLYSYSIDNLSGDSRWDTQTDGVRFSGSIESDFNVSYALELSRQKGNGDNPINYSTRYTHVELGVGASGLHASLGYESLGAEGQGFFVTPLASLHSFQGGADVFANGGLGNIAGGVFDRYARLTWDVDGMGFAVAYHQYESEDYSLSSALGSNELGEEWNLRLSYQWRYVSVAARYADYHSDGFGQDTRKSWLELTANF